MTMQSYNCCGAILVLIVTVENVKGAILCVLVIYIIAVH
jgi:hypothetical protein